MQPVSPKSAGSAEAAAPMEENASRAVKQLRWNEKKGGAANPGNTGNNNSGTGSNATVFQCSGFGDCHMVFTRSEHLARHVRKHTGERPFQCHCLKAFSRLDNLRQHCQTVHSDTPERNEEILRKLTVLHSNLAASAAKSQRSYAKVVSTDAPKSDDETKAKEKSSAPRALEKKSSTSPKSSVAVSSLLSIPEPEEYPLEDGRRQSQGTPSAVPLSLNMPILPPLRSKSVPRMFHSTAHPAYNPAGRFSPPTSAYHRSGVYVTSPTGSTLPLPASPPSFYSSRGSVNAPYTAEPKSTSALPPLSELSTKLGTPGGSNDPRPYSSRTCPAPQVERSPSSFNDRRATLPISNGSYGYATSGESNGPSYFSGSSNSSFRPYFGTSKFAPYMQSDTRSPPTWNAPAAKRPSSGPHFPNASPSTQRRSSVAGHPSFLQDKASDSMSNHDGAYTSSDALETSPRSLPPTNINRGDGYTRPMKKSRSGYFMGQNGSSPQTYNHYRHADLTPDGVGLSPLTNAIPRYSQFRCREAVGNPSLGYPAHPDDSDPSRFYLGRRWSNAELVSAGYKDGVSITKRPLDYYASQFHPTGLSEMEYRELPRKRHIGDVPP